MTITTVLATQTFDPVDWPGTEPEALPITGLYQALAGGAPGDSFAVGSPASREDPVFWADTLGWLVRSGSPEQPINLQFGTIGGPQVVLPPVDAAGPAQFRSVRTGFLERTNPDGEGQACFVIAEGASNFEVAGPSFFGAPDAGFFRFDGGGSAAYSGIRFSNIHARMAGRVFEADDAAVVDGAIFEHCTAVGLTRGFARFHTLSNSVFRDIRADAGMVDGTGERVCQVFSISDGENLRFENVSVRNAVNGLDALARGSTYIQGDGFVLEEGTRNVVFLGCHASNMGDGGFDLKTFGVTLIGCSAIGCKNGIRIWQQDPSNRIERSVIASPVSRPENAGSCVWCAGSVTIADSRLAASPQSSVFRFSDELETGAPSVRLERCQIEMPQGATLAAGAEGVIEMIDCLVGGLPTTQTFRWNGTTLE